MNRRRMLLLPVALALSAAARVTPAADEPEISVYLNPN